VAKRSIRFVLDLLAVERQGKKPPRTSSKSSRHGVVLESKVDVATGGEHTPMDNAVYAVYVLFATLLDANMILEAKRGRHRRDVRC